MNLNGAYDEWNMPVTKDKCTKKVKFMNMGFNSWVCLMGTGFQLGTGNTSRGETRVTDGCAAIGICLKPLMALNG